jgi:hypothetical protein
MQYAPSIRELNVTPNGLLVSIDRARFGGCTILILPNGVVSVGDSKVFSELNRLAYVVLPAGLISIGVRVFNGCARLVSIPLPRSLISIGSMAFAGCNSLISIAFPDGLTIIEDNAFSGCTGLVEVVMPRGLQVVKTSTFEGCTSLVDIVFPAGLTKIGQCAFAGCTSLVDVVFQEGLQAIGKHAFAGCSNLRTVTLPEMMPLIDREAFKCCTALETLIVSPSSKLWVDEPAWTRVTWTRVTTELPALRRVWAPDRVIARLGGPFEFSTCFADLPRAKQAESWAGLQLRRWCKSGGGHRKSRTRKQLEFEVMLFSTRLCREIDTFLPPEMWLLILSFVPHPTLRQTLESDRLSAIWLSPR